MPVPLAPRHSLPGQRPRWSRQPLPTVALAVLLLTPACAGPGPGAAAESAAPSLGPVRDQVAALLTAIADDLAAAGPEAWEWHAAPDFAMASDGVLAFADRAALAAFVRDYDGQVERMSLAWDGLEVLSLSPGWAWFGGPYDELIVHTDGDEDRFGGFVTGLAVRGDDGWRLQRLHWSSPRAADGD